ncbi:MAG: hypothetical protein GKC00_00160 [Candidatus Methanofastidiosa archaeon]|nr:hypothetical protein [Candidatus Methanofastidiosa archaeon]
MSGISSIVKDSIDMHYHIGPDILPRRDTVESLLKNEQGKITGIALKSHGFPTISAINTIEEKPEFPFLIGSITLNYFMGGFNPSAIYASATMSKGAPIIVWFPTIHAENHLLKNHSEYEIPPEWVRDPKFKPRLKSELKAIKVTDWNSKLFEKCNRVLKAIKENNCILATGHLSWQESYVLAKEALKMDIPTIITHPMQRDIKMPIEIQKELASKGAYIEHCYVMWLDRDHPEDYPLKTIKNDIEEVGYEHCIISTDAGQIRNPSPSECLETYMNLLHKEGISEQALATMAITNPRKILGMEIK